MRDAGAGGGWHIGVGAVQGILYVTCPEVEEWHAWGCSVTPHVTVSWLFCPRPKASCLLTGLCLASPVVQLQYAVDTAEAAVERTREEWEGALPLLRQIGEWRRTQCSDRSSCRTPEAPACTFSRTHLARMQHTRGRKCVRNAARVQGYKAKTCGTYGSSSRTRPCLPQPPYTRRCNARAPPAQACPSASPPCAPGPGRPPRCTPAPCTSPGAPLEP